MCKITFPKTIFLVLSIVFNHSAILGQQTPIINYSINVNGQVQLEVNSSAENYYILKIRHNPSSEFQLPTSMTLGKPGTTVITEPLGNYPLEHYQVLEYPIDTPVDTDGDGIDDMTEYQNMPMQGPMNAAPPIDIDDGVIVIDSFASFKKLSITKEYVQWSEFLNGKGFVKFMIVDFHTSSPKIYFINSYTHDLHSGFANKVGIDHIGDQVKTGQIIYHPTTVSNNGTLGTFTFNYSNGHGQDFDVVQKSHELLAANMPFLKNNLSYFITPRNEDEYERDIALFQDARIPVLFEADIYAEIDYWGLNQTEGFGFFRRMALEEIPGPKDIVFYEALPNSLPRVGGIISSVIQTPLSHVNLRAIQNNIPNAFIREPLAIDSIADLLDHYIYFKVAQDHYFIREADLEEVNAWFEDIRPDEEQTPPLNLEYTSILPLDDITFEMFDGFGAKCANVATMRTFGFPAGTIPDGFGVPFYFYQEFMKYNHFFEEIEVIINNPEFQSDRVLRDEMLNDFRKKIKDAAMPTWMLNELAAMQAAFPSGTSIRCRSSTNNEDLPGFNGAGLYTSKTQHPDEGHIAKSIKQVYASLWNLRAFEEREFYRINHFSASMGVLCHPNYSDEKANGVGVSIDPLYQTDNTFYLNSQVGEELITNPGATSIPEEILLDRVSFSENDYIVIQRSNLAPNNGIIMREEYLDQMRDYLSIIHDEFEALYHAEDNESFAMDIEYKITSDGQLIIKQARPWVSYEPLIISVKAVPDHIDLKIFPNPAHEYIYVQCDDCKLTALSITDSMGKQMHVKTLGDANHSNIQIFIRNLPPGVYVISGLAENTRDYFSKKFVKK
ncbi:MAG: PEP/pyruvate-binding domain-containing protein [Saprospiraceae bacterium]